MRLIPQHSTTLTYTKVSERNDQLLGGDRRLPSYREALIGQLWDGKDPFHERDAFANRVDYQGWASNHPYLSEAVIELKPTTIIEIGVWKGGSVLTFAKSLQSMEVDGAIIAVDTWLGSSEHWDSKEWFQDLRVEAGYPTLFRTFAANIIDSRLTGYVVPIPLDSLNAAYLLKKRHIVADVIHIDGGHDYHAVMSDLRVWWPLLREDGILIGDDYHPDGGPWPEVAAAFHEFFQTTDIENIGGKCRIRKVGNSPQKLVKQETDTSSEEITLTSFAADRLFNNTEAGSFETSTECSMLTDPAAINYYMPPIFPSKRDKEHFKNDYWHKMLPPLGIYPNESRVLRANDKFIMGVRGLEGVMFDQKEVFKNIGSLQTLVDPAPFRRKDGDFGIPSSYLANVPQT